MPHDLALQSLRQSREALAALNVGTALQICEWIQQNKPNETANLASVKAVLPHYKYMFECVGTTIDRSNKKYALRLQKPSKVAPTCSAFEFKQERFAQNGDIFITLRDGSKKRRLKKEEQDGIVHILYEDGYCNVGRKEDFIFLFGALILKKQRKVDSKSF